MPDTINATDKEPSWRRNLQSSSFHFPSRFSTAGEEKKEDVLLTLSESERKRLLDAREAVWRAYFAGDRAALEKLLPEELITLEPGGSWGNRKAVLDGSAGFAAGGGKLVRLEFPKTEIQSYGSTAIVYSNYVYEIEQGGKRSSNSGRVTEVFVNRNGAWVNPSWHMDTGH